MNVMQENTPRTLPPDIRRELRSYEYLCRLGYKIGKIGNHNVLYIGREGEGVFALAQSRAFGQNNGCQKT
ncbi:MAG: hypothetical protein J6Y85_05630 [Alphaproteobacteria bacterium]|nr:hypothetical protein [Alphaproteobacteria bacterium]